MFRVVSANIIFLMISFSSIPSLSDTQVSSQPMGKVRGTVMDYNEAVILNTKIFIEGENIERSLVVNERGEYEIELPAGIYNITAEANLFRPFRRAVFRVQSNVTTMINIVPVPMATHVASPPVYYNSFSIPRSPDPRIKLLIEHTKKRNRGRFIEYENVTVSYDALTILAGKVRFNKKAKQLEFESEWRSVIDDGRKRIFSRNGLIRFIDGTPDIVLTRG